MLNAPARRPAIPARRMKLPWPEAPATPITSDRLETSPSDTPKIVARSVPDRPLVCQRSPRAIVVGGLRRARLDARMPAGGDELDRRPPAAPAAVPSRAFASPSRRFQISACSRSSAAIASTAGCVSWASYTASSSPSTALTRSLTARVPNSAGEHDDEPDPGARTAGGRHGGSQLPEPVLPDRGVPPLVAGDVAERGGACLVLLDRGEGVVQHDGVLLELEVLEARGDVHASNLANAAGPARAMRGARFRRRGVASAVARPSPTLRRHDRPAAAALPHRRGRRRRDAAPPRAPRPRRSRRCGAWPAAPSCRRRSACTRGRRRRSRTRCRRCCRVTRRTAPRTGWA